MKNKDRSKNVNCALFPLGLSNIIIGNCSAQGFISMIKGSNNEEKILGIRNNLIKLLVVQHNKRQVINE